MYVSVERYKLEPEKFNFEILLENKSKESLDVESLIILPSMNKSRRKS